MQIFWVQMKTRCGFPREWWLAEDINIILQGQNGQQHLQQNIK